jgi:hypothetical protein
MDHGGIQRLEILKRVFAEPVPRILSMVLLPVFIKLTLIVKRTVVLGKAYVGLPGVLRVERESRILKETFLIPIALALPDELL